MRALMVLALPAASVLWWFFPLQDAGRWERGAPPEAWAHRRQQEAELRERVPAVPVRFHYVPAGAMSVDLKLAVLVAEDVSFFAHGPVDVDAVREALNQWVDGRPLRGASTISQQLAKNLFLTSERSLWRKLQELRMAFWLERHLSKARIFELYLNVIELGEGVYGVDAAARYYFRLTAAELDAEQAASLAAGIPAPTTSNARTKTAAWKRRRAAVVDRMERLRHLRSVVAHTPRRDATGPRQVELRERGSQAPRRQASPK